MLPALMRKARSMTRLTVDSLRLTGIRSMSCPRENNRLEAAVGPQGSTVLPDIDVTTGTLRLFLEPYCQDTLNYT